MRADGASVTFTGYHVAGEGSAHRWFKTRDMNKHLRQAFGHEMVGTFNVKAPPRAVAEILELVPAVHSRYAHIRADYYRCTVRKGQCRRDGFILVTCDRKFNPHPPPRHVEILTQIPLPEEFKTGRLEVRVGSGGS